MSWKIKIDDLAERQLSKLDHTTKEKIVSYIFNVVGSLDNPKDLGKALVGSLKGYWRYRVGKYRIFCRIKSQHKIIMVFKIGKRDQVYKD